MKTQKKGVALSLLLILFIFLSCFQCIQKTTALSTTENFINGDFESGSTGWDLTGTSEIINGELNITNSGTAHQEFASPVPLNQIRYFAVDFVSTNNTSGVSWQVYLHYSDGGDENFVIAAAQIAYDGIGRKIDLYTYLNYAKTYLTDITIVYSTSDYYITFDGFHLTTCAAGDSSTERIVDGGFDFFRFLDSRVFF